MPTGLREDECASALNVEWWLSALGERRLGCSAFALTDSGLTTEDAIVHLAEHFPTNDIQAPEYWAIGATPGTSSKVAKCSAGTWAAVTPDDAITDDAPGVYGIQSQPLNGKLFFAYPSEENRLHVWDGTSLRRTGIAQPGDAPTVANTGSGTFAETRWYRVRFIERNVDGVTVRRSEPSDDVEFTPSGSGASARITQPTPVDEGETHWEVEASSDGDFFFLIATVAIATTTYDDSTDLSSSSYSLVGLASEEIGAYLLQESVKFLAADGDRLLTAGHWSDAGKQSRVSWSPVVADPGAGNDERLPLQTGGDNYVDLDNYEGGAITGISKTTIGTWYAFKWSHIYRLARTGDVNHAYEPTCVTKARGALPGSIVEGLDEAGRPVIFFLDPAIGPCMVGASGLRVIRGLHDTWQSVTVTADSDVMCRAIYYGDKQQVQWWVPTNDATTPTLKIVVQVNLLRQSDEGGAVSGGISLANGLIAKAVAAAIWHETTIENGVERLRARPFIGLAQGDDVTSSEMLQRCDVGDTDNDVAYVASIITRPYVAAGLLNQWGVMVAALLASTSSTASLSLSCIRDFGLETLSKTVSLTATSTEDYATRVVDDLVMSEARVVQFKLSDA